MLQLLLFGVINNLDKKVEAYILFLINFKAVITRIIFQTTIGWCQQLSGAIIYIAKKATIFLILYLVLLKIPDYFTPGSMVTR